MKPTAPIQTIREQIADRLRADILSGELSEGQPLREEPLGKRFGVSRGPIRDVLMQLTQEGLLVSKTNCGVRVGSAPSEEIQPLVVSLRKEIEEYALRQVFDDLTDVDIQTLENSVEQLRTACERGDLADVARYDMAFHRAILDLTENGDLIAIWLPIVLRMMMHYTRHADMMESYQEHERILEAIRSRDVEQSVTALMDNIQ